MIKMTTKQKKRFGYIEQRAYFLLLSDAQKW